MSESNDVSLRDRITKVINTPCGTGISAVALIVIGAIINSGYDDYHHRDKLSIKNIKVEPCRVKVVLPLSYSKTNLDYKKDSDIDLMVPYLEDYAPFVFHKLIRDKKRIVSEDEFKKLINALANAYSKLENEQNALNYDFEQAVDLKSLVKSEGWRYVEKENLGLNIFSKLSEKYLGRVRGLKLSNINSIMSDINKKLTTKKALLSKNKNITNRLLLRAESLIRTEKFQIKITIFNAGDSKAAIYHYGDIFIENYEVKIKTNDNNDQFLFVEENGYREVDFTLDLDDNGRKKVNLIHSVYDKGREVKVILYGDSSKNKKICSRNFFFIIAEEDRESLKEFIKSFREKHSYLKAEKPHALLFAPQPAAQSLLLNFRNDTFLADYLESSGMFARWAGAEDYLQKSFDQPIPINKERTLAQK